MSNTEDHDDDAIGLRVVIAHFRVEPGGRGTPAQQIRVMLKNLLRQHGMKCERIYVADPKEKRGTRT